MIEESASFLVVDDDDAFRSRLARAIKSRGYAVNESACPEEAIRIAKKTKPSHIILDLRMPKKTGLETLKELKQVTLKSKVLILTGYGSIATALEAVREGAIHYLSKPTDLDRIFEAFTNSTTKPQQLKAVPSLSRVEWEHIQRIMHECEGNVSKAAKLLGIHRRSLQRKLKSPPES